MPLFDSLKTYVDGLMSPACVVTRGLEIVYTNYQFLDMAKVTQRELRRGMRCNECLKLDILNGSDSIVASCIDTHRTVQLREVKGANSRDDFTLLCVQVGSAGGTGSDSGFTPDDKPNALSLSSCDAIEKICAIILREIDGRGYSEESIWAAKLCIHEALMNALIHGNKNNRAKKVSVFYKVTDDKFSVSVIDEGEGFDHRNLPDPKTCQHLLKDGGRGLFFIRQYMDEVTFNEKGNRIMLVKYLTPRGK